jgi:hypothetical protein
VIRCREPANRVLLAVMSCQNDDGLGAARSVRGPLSWAAAARPVRKGNAMANRTVVLAIFNDEAAADTAADALKKSGVAHHDAIGVMALDGNGKVKTHKMGKRSVGLGIGIGVVLALFAPIGLVVGLVGGGLVALHHKGLGIDAADRERIGRELQGGKAAVGVLAPVSEAKVVADKLTELGGVAETHDVSDEDLDEAHAAATADQATSGTDQA